MALVELVNAGAWWAGPAGTPDGAAWANKERDLTALAGCANHAAPGREGQGPRAPHMAHRRARRAGRARRRGLPALAPPPLGDGGSRSLPVGRHGAIGGARGPCPSRPGVHAPHS